MLIKLGLKQKMVLLQKKRVIIWNNILQKIVWLWRKLIVFLNTRINKMAQVRSIIPSLF